MSRFLVKGGWGTMVARLGPYVITAVFMVALAVAVLALYVFTGTWIGW